jgi:hypothetical protein
VAWSHQQQPRTELNTASGGRPTAALANALDCLLSHTVHSLVGGSMLVHAAMAAIAWLCT